MSDLSPRARELIQRAARGGGPSESQRRALKKAVFASVLGPGLALAATSKLLLVGGVVAALGGAGVAAVFLKRHAPHAPPRVSMPSPAPVAAVLTPPKVEPEVEAVVETSREPVLPARRKPVRATPLSPRDLPPEPAPPGEDGLTREMKALDRAMRAVDASHFDDGLEAARAFLIQFPESQFTPEARVVEVLALCGLLRFEEARAQAARLPPEAEGTPAAHRLAHSCVDPFAP